MIDIKKILYTAKSQEASDIHFKVGVIPILRKNRKLYPIDPSYKNLTLPEMEHILKSLLNKSQYGEFTKEKELDFGLTLTGVGRFRFNVFHHRSIPRIVVRIIPETPPLLKNLNLPDVVTDTIANFSRGLILIAGSAGSGKTWTSAGILQYINEHKSAHILTIEDPIEFILHEKRSLISQREVGADVKNLTRGLASALRQDPDVIFFGEIRTREQAETALEAADTGHLVLSTVHALDASETISRVLSLFDGKDLSLRRVQFASVLKSVVSQRLVNTKANDMIVAAEILISTERIREIIKDPSKHAELHTAIGEGSSAYNMQTFEQSLMDLIQKGKISIQEAKKISTRSVDFKIKLNDLQKTRNSKLVDPSSDDSEIPLEIDNEYNSNAKFKEGSKRLGGLFKKNRNKKVG